MKDQMNIHNDKGFEDIEQLLHGFCTGVTLSIFEFLGAPT
jgi:hypothetical protein